MDESASSPHPQGQSFAGFATDCIECDVKGRNCAQGRSCRSSKNYDGREGSLKRCNGLMPAYEGDRYGSRFQHKADQPSADRRICGVDSHDGAGTNPSVTAYHEERSYRIDIAHCSLSGRESGRDVDHVIGRPSHSITPKTRSPDGQNAIAFPRTTNATTGARNYSRSLKASDEGQRCSTWIGTTDRDKVRGIDRGRLNGDLDFARPRLAGSPMLQAENRFRRTEHTRDQARDWFVTSCKLYFRSTSSSRGLHDDFRP